MSGSWFLMYEDLNNPEFDFEVTLLSTNERDAVIEARRYWQKHRHDLASNWKDGGINPSQPYVVYIYQSPQPIAEGE